MTDVSVTLRPPCSCLSVLVSLRRAQTWRLNAKLCKSGRHTSLNNARMKNNRNLILGEDVYIAIIYHIPDRFLPLLPWVQRFFSRWGRQTLLAGGEREDLMPLFIDFTDLQIWSHDWCLMKTENSFCPALLWNEEKQTSFSTTVKSCNI